MDKLTITREEKWFALLISDGILAGHLLLIVKDFVLISFKEAGIC